MNLDNLMNKALELGQIGTPYAWATVVNVSGSTPRNVGAKMIITKDETMGTVGGGSLEHNVINDARKQIRLAESLTKSYSLDPEHGQACGGKAEVFIETVLPKREAVVFGAGHIGVHLCPMLKELGFNVTLVDERKDRVSLPAFKSADKILNEKPSSAFKKIKYSDGLYLFVLTHAHIHDEEIVKYCLDKPFKYLGLISSRTKWELFKDHYKCEGYSDEQISRVTTPIGLDIGSETPFEIAVSIVAEVIKTYRTPKGFEEFKQCKK